MKSRNVLAPKTRAAASIFAVDLLDERDHHQDHERHGRHEVGEDDAGHGAGETRRVEHGGERDAEGDRRDEQRQQEEQHHQALAGEVAAGERVGGGDAEHAGKHHDDQDDLEGDDEHLVELELGPGRAVPARRPAGREPGAKPARREGADTTVAIMARRLTTKKPISTQTTVAQSLAPSVVSRTIGLSPSPRRLGPR